MVPPPLVLILAPVSVFFRGVTSVSSYVANYDKATSVSFESSLWCQGAQDHRQCFFRNLCYSPHHRQFLFFHSNRSYLSGLQHPEEQHQLVRLAPGSGTEEDDDSAFLNYVPLPLAAYNKYKIAREDRPVLLLTRSDGSDMYKVILEDLLAIYLTMRQLCFGEVAGCFKRYILAVTDAGEPSKHNYLYQMFFEKEVAWLDKPKVKGAPFESDRITCFSKAFVGAEAPSVLDGDIRPSHLADFRQAVVRKLAHIHSRFGLEYPDVVFLGHKKAEQIINRKELLDQASGEFLQRFDILNATGTGNITLSNLNMEQHSDEHILRTISKAKLVIGPHGSHMIASFFLPSGSGILELFPFALKPETLPLVSVLAEKRGLSYSSWSNKNVDKSFSFPYRPPNEGGIAHLDKKTQDIIQSMTDLETSDTLSLDDPAYLFRLNQHTKVDLRSFKTVLGGLLDQMKQEEEGGQDFSGWIVPSKVYGITCAAVKGKEGGGSKLKITWLPPLNLGYLPAEQRAQIKYEVLLEKVAPMEEMGMEFLGRSSTRDTRVEVDGVDLRKIRLVKVLIIADVGTRGGGVETAHYCDMSHLDFGGGG